MIIDRLGQLRLTLPVNNARSGERHSVMRKILPLYLSVAMISVAALLVALTGGASYGAPTPQLTTPMTASPVGSSGAMGCC